MAVAGKRVSRLQVEAEFVVAGFRSAHASAQGRARAHARPPLQRLSQRTAPLGRIRFGADEPGDFAAAGAAVCPRFELLADRRDGAHPCAAASRISLRPTSKQAQTVGPRSRASAPGRPARRRSLLRRNRFAETFGKPGARHRDGLARGEQGADERPVVESDETVLTGGGVAIGDEVDVVAERERRRANAVQSSGAARPASSARHPPRAGASAK